MCKIILIENTNVLQHRIESIFNKRKDVIIETIRGKTIRVEKLLTDTMHLIIDVDNFQGTLKTFLAEIRQNKIGKNTLITLMASRPDETLVLMAARYGEIDILTKPFSDIEFLKKVLRHRPAPLIEDIKLKDKEDSNFTFKWSDEYRIGVELIDDEHKQIVDNFEQLYMKINNGNGIEYYEEMLIFIKKYISFHFEHEEELQRNIAYDEIANHMSKHKNFKIQIDQVINGHKGKDVTNQDLIKLVLFIKEWLIHHILVEDKKIGELIHSSN